MTLIAMVSAKGSPGVSTAALACTLTWPGATLLLTDGLGHRRILRAPDVLAASVAFVAARTAERRARPRPDADFVESLPALAYEG